ncbi:Glutamine amidotransferases class-II [Pseudomonas syringae BRIP39023]|nr:Glutamine amidotransferases class-II [Pseudomonas syringae BRIP39023]
MGPPLCAYTAGGGPERLQIPQRGDYRIAHFLRTDFDFAFRPDVAGADTLIQNQADSLFDGVGRIGQIEAVTQHHRHRQNGRQRVGNAFAGDVRRRAVTWLVHALVGRVQRGRRQHADGAGEHRRLIGEDVAEQVVGHDHIELLGCTHQLHGGIVDVHVAQFDFRVILGDLLDDFTPQLAGREYVGLVHRAELLATHHGHIETDPGNAADLAFAVRQRVVGLTLAIIQHPRTAWRTEVDTTGQLANDQDIQAGDDFRLQARRVGQLRIQDRRTQVAEQAQLRTDFQQTALRTDVALDGVPFRAADCTEQHGVGRTGTIQGFIGQRHAVLVDGRATDHVVGQFKPQLILFVGQLQHLDRFGHDFRTNTITWENQNLLAHNILDFVHRRL